MDKLQHITTISEAINITASSIIIINFIKSLFKPRHFKIKFCKEGTNNSNIKYEIYNPTDRDIWLEKSEYWDDAAAEWKKSRHNPTWHLLHEINKTNGFCLKPCLPPLILTDINLTPQQKKIKIKIIPAIGRPKKISTKIV